MSKKYDALVLIGRFQPFHNAHLEIVRRATALTKHLIIVTGSAAQPRTYKNPFTSNERERMIRLATNGIVSGNFTITVASNVDTIYNDQAWAIRVQKIVSVNARGSETQKIGVIGHKKDESSFYLDMFPQWEFVNVEEVEPLSAVNIRDLYFKRDANMNFIKNVVPPTTFQFLTSFKDTVEYEQIIKEREFIEGYKKQYASLPYPPVFVTTDAVVICSGHVLMIKRRSEPGKGLWALPGGFLNADTDKSVEDCMLRELKEETGIKVPVPVLKGSIQDNHVFDAIGRSTRGRTITHAFKIVLADGELPKVKGQDDAEKARWVPIGELDSSVCYEDHYEILQYFVGA
jgi:bifunctional NMN adenylyltransferase/nudix hydrolase